MSVHHDMAPMQIMMVDQEILSKVYMAAGVVLPLFYLHQVRVCLRDQTKLHAFSLSKATTQLLLRLAMIPFLLTVDSHEILYIALIDFAARSAEVLAAIFSLRRQGERFGAIFKRCSPFAHGALVAGDGAEKSKWGSQPAYLQMPAVQGSLADVAQEPFPAEIPSSVAKA